MATLKKRGTFVILPTALVTCLVAFVLLATVPPPGANITFLVSADPGLKTSETRIDEVRLSGTGGDIAIYTDTGQTKTVEVGTDFRYVNLTVFIAKTHAEDDEQARAYTKVTVTITDPAVATIYTGSLTAGALVTERATWWEVHYTTGTNITPVELVEGQYTVTVKYEIYV